MFPWQHAAIDLALGTMGVRLQKCPEETVHVFDHVARTLWPATPEERAALAVSYGGLLAEDGLTLDIGAPETRA